MKDVFKYVGIALLIVFSFYYTDKIASIIIYKSDLMTAIVSQKELYEKKSINASVSAGYITPGLNGIEVDDMGSYYQMKSANEFDSKKLIYKQIFPEISLENHKHLVINKINSYKRSVALIVGDNPEVQKYLEEKKIKANILVTKESFNENSFLEQINKDCSKTVDKLLENNNLNNELYYVDQKDKVCKDKYLVTKTYTVNNQSVVNLDVKSGDIIYLDKNLSVYNLKVLLKTIAYWDLKIDYLSNLISEQRLT